jgi:hypothetical protein
MKIRRRIAKLTTVAIVVSLPLLGISGVALAAKKGTPKWCASHPAKAASVAACASSSSGGSGGPGDPPTITVQIDPNPQVETGESFVSFTVQVESSPSFAGDDVSISSSQLAASCSPILYGFFALDAPPPGYFSVIQVPLDDDGNATVVFSAQDCAPGPSVVEASLDVAPYYTALGTFTAEAPVVTTSGLFGYPTTSGTVTGGEVETGDTGPAIDQSDVYAVFYVETDPVYAEQQVEISSAQLQARCGAYWEFESVAESLGITGGDLSYGQGSVLAPGSSTTATATLDDDGNAAFFFLGGSCGAGTSDVIADVLAGSHPTYTSTFTIVAPQPTI